MVLDETLKIVWKSDKVRSENLAASVEIVDIFRNGEAFSWQVVGYFSDGRTIKSKPIEIAVQLMELRKSPVRTNPAQKNG